MVQDDINTTHQEEDLNIEVYKKLVRNYFKLELQYEKYGWFNEKVRITIEVEDIVDWAGKC